MTRVVHCKRESCDVLIDRTTIWGNPFVIGKDGDRDDVCDKHELWLLRYLFWGEEIKIRKFSNKKVIQSLYLLKNQTIGCWCKPKRCHGDMLARLANFL